ncbi:carbohydrate-binding protein [Paenibacillus glycinis]|uniref:Carbohydrate-binding protein n=1 Tax=Paenibacillus glycinis TaxID=2697035 RepID=A0ABW9XMT0_9BACL|nr:carbohydrate-binding protein [Paenibacillus glycinis]NBD23714.1 carbohydrate-binding protein [Paenibacillus glycinis]
MVRKPSKSSRLWVSAIALSLTVSAWSGIGARKAQAFAASDADTAIKAFNDAFWDAGAKYFWTNSNRDANYQGFWVEAELWELVMDAYEHTSDAGLKAQLRAQIDDIFDGTVAKYGEDWTDNHFNDDIMWWAMASARAYGITKEPRYLEKAKHYFDFVYDTQWDDGFANGGIWWMNSDHSTKNACINFPAAEAAVVLYNATKDEHYLEAATRIYRWSKTMLTDGEGKVFDRIEMKNGAVPDATHYNQGTFIGAAVGLYGITGDEVYLDDAVKGATFTKTRLVDKNGLLNYEGPNGDLKGGKTILIRNLDYLQRALDKQGKGRYAQFGKQFGDWLTLNADTAWSNRNPANIVDGNWAGQLLSGTYESWSSAAAVEALTVLKPGKAELRDGKSDPYAKTEAEAYRVGSGFGLEGSPEGTLQLGGIQAGGYAVYKNMDFGAKGAAGFIARVSSATGGGNIELRLDSLTGPKVGTLNVKGTGSWNNFTNADMLLKNEQGDASKVTGKHDVYLVFAKTNDAYLFNLNWFQFTAGDPTKTDAYARLAAGNFDEGSGLGKNAEGGFVDGIHNNAYALYKGIDFGSGAGGVAVHVASGNQGGTIDVKLDRPDGPTAGTIEIPALGGWESWVDIVSNMDDKLAVGVHDVYLVFHGTDGSDYPCNLDWFTFTTVKGKARDAYGKLEAEDNSGGTGFGTENGGGQTYLAGINGANSPYAMFNYVDFGESSPAKLYVNAASDTAGGTIEVRLDSLNGPVIATDAVAGTGGWQNFAVTSTDVSVPVTGKHIVFLLFKGTDYLFNLDKFTFGDPKVFTDPEVPPVQVPDHTAPGDVENVRASQDNDAIRLSWDGPYDIDGQKVRLQPMSGKRAIGEPVDIGRGVQTATLTGLADAPNLVIAIKALDTSGNASKGITVNLGDYPGYALTAGGKDVQENGSLEDSALLTFKAAGKAAPLTSAAITIDGQTYAADLRKKDGLEIDLAGRLGMKEVVVEVRDALGNELRKSFALNVVASVDGMNRLLDRYKKSGALSGALVPLLNDSLDQSRHQLKLGRKDAAIKQMQTFVKQLNDPAMARWVKAEAKAVLNTDALQLIQDWQRQ